MLREMQGTHERAATAVVSGELFRTVAPETENRPPHDFDSLAGFRFHLFKKIQFFILSNVNGVRALGHRRAEKLSHVDFTEKVKIVRLTTHKGYTRAIER